MLILHFKVTLITRQQASPQLANKLLRIQTWDAIYSALLSEAGEQPEGGDPSTLLPSPLATMAGLPLATVAFHLCLLASSSAALRLAPETTGEGRHVGRTAYHFQPAKNWQNGKRADLSSGVCAIP